MRIRIDAPISRFNTNRVIVHDEYVIKEFRRFLPYDLAGWLWGYVARKPYRSPRQRYQREKQVLLSLAGKQLNIPRLINYDDPMLSLTYERIELRPLSDLFAQSNVPAEQKINLFGQSLRLLRRLHDYKVEHGGALLKNFFLLESPYLDPKLSVYTCDFECERLAEQPYTLDVLMLTAEAVTLSQGDIRLEQALSMVCREYGPFEPFQFERRDIWFYGYRLGMPIAFFDFFSREHPDVSTLTSKILL